MASVRELLGLGPSEGRGSKGPPQKKLKLDSKKLDGMQRELYSLLGENTPSISIGPHGGDTRFRNRPNWKQKATPWKWAGFKNSARENNDADLVLYHWMKGSDVVSGTEGQMNESAFAKLNTKVEVPSFTKEEYDKILTHDDWTFEETRYLFELCQEYDLRWVVIHDRYDWERPPAQENNDSRKEEGEDNEERDEEKEGGGKKNGDKKEEVKKESTKEDGSKDHEIKTGSKERAVESKNKSEEKEKSQKKEKQEKESENKDANVYRPYYPRIIEDLKDRYYSVSRALLDQKGPFQTSEQDQIKQMNYSKEAEIKRRAHLEQLLKRTPSEIAEEEALVLESRKLEAAAERMLAERNEILRLLDAPQATASIAQYQTSQGLAQLTSTLLTSDRNRKRKENTPGSSGTATPVSGAGPAATAAGGASTGSGGTTKRNGMALAAQVMQKKLSSKEEQALGISYHDKLPAGVYLRSTKITSLKPSIQAKVTGVMAELGVAARPLMPTAKVCAKFESLQQSISVLLEAKRQYDKLDAELKIAKGQSK